MELEEIAPSPIVSQSRSVKRKGDFQQILAKNTKVGKFTEITSAINGEVKNLVIADSESEGEENMTNMETEEGGETPKSRRENTRGGRKTRKDGEESEEESPRSLKGNYQWWKREREKDAKQFRDILKEHVEEEKSRTEKERKELTDLVKKQNEDIAEFKKEMTKQIGDLGSEMNNINNRYMLSEGRMDRLEGVVEDMSNNMCKIVERVVEEKLGKSTADQFKREVMEEVKESKKKLLFFGVKGDNPTQRVREIIEGANITEKAKKCLEEGLWISKKPLSQNNEINQTRNIQVTFDSDWVRNQVWEALKREGDKLKDMRVGEEFPQRYKRKQTEYEDLAYYIRKGEGNYKTRVMMMGIEIQLRVRNEDGPWWVQESWYPRREEIETGVESEGKDDQLKIKFGKEFLQELGNTMILVPNMEGKKLKDGELKEIIQKFLENKAIPIKEMVDREGNLSIKFELRKHAESALRTMKNGTEDTVKKLCNIKLPHKIF